MGILYLIQPAELVGTDRYKIGCSTKSTLDRVTTGYKKGTKILYVIECDNPFETEKILKKKFNKKFKLITGNEYFEGDKEEMKKIFYSVVMNNSDYSEDNVDEIDDRGCHIIKTYEKFIEFMEISKIIITNKNGKGYLRFKGRYWIKLDDQHHHNNIDDDSDNDYGENLYDFIPEFVKYEITEYKTLWGICKKEQIYNDIIKKCYVKESDLIYYDLKYNEHFVSIGNVFYGDGSKQFIFDAKNIKLLNLDELINNKILTYDSFGLQIYEEDMNSEMIDIVDNIIDSLIGSEKKMEYKNLLYNVLVEQEKENIVFYDYGYCHLTLWLRLVIPLSCHLCSDDYYDNEKSFIKKLKTGRIRFLILYPKSESDDELEEEINLFKNLGIKNIIVMQINKGKQIYQIENCKEYLQKNKEKILDFCRRQETKYEVEYREIDFSEYKMDGDKYDEEFEDLFGGMKYEHVVSSSNQGRRKCGHRIDGNDYDKEFKDQIEGIFLDDKYLKSTFFMWACTKS